jgi:hypothetical protein
MRGRGNSNEREDTPTPSHRILLLCQPLILPFFFLVPSHVQTLEPQGRSGELGRQTAAAAAAAARNSEITIKSCKLTVSNNAPLVEPPQEPLLPARLSNLIAESHSEADVVIILIIYW